MPIVVTTLAVTLVSGGPAFLGFTLPGSHVSEPTAMGSATPVSMAPTPAAPAPVAGPPVPADVAGPPSAAPADLQAAALAPGSDPVEAATPLPTAEGLSLALSEARARQADRSTVVADSPTGLDDPLEDDPLLSIVEDPGYDSDAYNALYADDPPELRVSGYGGISVRGSSISHNPAVWVGGRAGLLFGEHFSIGGAFHEVSYRHGGPIVDPAGRELGIRAAYGGLEMGYGLVNRDRFHLNLDILIGGGAACISSDPGYDDGDWRCIERVKMFVTEPALAARFDVIEWFRLGLSTGYRFASREAWRPPNDFQLSGPYVGLDFDFGWFALED